MEARSGKLAIERPFRIGASGCADSRVGAAAGRLLDRISRQTGIPMMGEPRRETHRRVRGPRTRNIPRSAKTNRTRSTSAAEGAS